MFTSDYADPHLAKGRGAIERITSSPSVRSSVLQLLLLLPLMHSSLLSLSRPAAAAAALRGVRATAGGAKQTMHQSIKISAPNKPQTSDEEVRGGAA